MDLTQLIPLLAAPFVGSFIATLVIRLPQGAPVLWARSACDHCATVLRPLELVPILSWAALGGRCRHCRQPIGWIHPACELGAVVLVLWAIQAVPGELVPAGRPVVSLLPPGNIKIRFFVPETALAKVALGQAVTIHCDGCKADVPAKVTFISRSSEFTPPVIYSLDERSKLVFLIEARTETPVDFRVGQPVDVRLAETRK